MSMQHRDVEEKTMNKTNVSWRRKRGVAAAVAIGGILALAGVEMPDAGAAVDPLAPYDPLSDAELSGLRGGFSFAGEDWSFGIEIMVKSIVESAFGSIGLVSVLKLENETIISHATEVIGDASSEAADVTDDGFVTTVETEDTTIRHELAKDGLLSVLSTDGDRQDILTTANVTITVPSGFDAVVQSFAKSFPALRNLTREIGLAGIRAF